MAVGTTKCDGDLAGNRHVATPQAIKVLLVEDNQPDIHLMREYLSGDSGISFDIAVCQRLDEAIATVSGSSFDIVMLDLTLPDSSGIDTFYKMHAAAGKTPIVVMTGLSDEDLAMEAVSGGAQDYMVKDKSGKDLLVRSLRYAVQRSRTEEHLHRMEREKLAILDSMSEFLVYMDCDMNVKWVNKAVTDSVGIEMEALCGLRCRVWCGRESPCGQCPAALAISSGKVHEGERHFRDGRVWSCRASPVLDADGKIVGVIETATDVTQRKRTEEALGWGKHLLNTLLDNVPDHIYFKDISGKYIRINKAMALRLGVEDPSHAAGKSEHDYHPMQQANLSLEEDRLVMSSGKAINDKEIQVEWPDGTVSWASVSKMPLYDRDGNLLGTFGMARDITSHKKTEETLRESEDKYRRLFDEAPTGYHELDTQGCIIQVNQTELRMLGYAIGEMIGKPIWEFVDEPNARELVFGKLSGKIPTGRSFERYYRRKDGGRVPVLVDENLLYDNKGTIIGMRTTIADISDRKYAEDMVQRQLQRLGALRDIDMAINASMDLRLTLPILLEKVTAAIHADAAAILLLSPYTQSLEYASGRGFRTDAIKRARLRLGEGFAGSAAIERRTVCVSDMSHDGNVFTRRELVEREGVVSYYCVPLISKGQVKGVMEIFYRSMRESDPEWIEFLETMAGQAALAIDNAAMFDGLQRSNVDLVLAYDYTIEGWSKALELRDAETEGHAIRVTDMTVQLCRVLGMREEELAHARRGSLLHDIGKMGIPDSILLKPGPLTDEEWRVMRKHPSHAFELLNSVAYLRPALDIPYCHHEKWDGSGYPRKLKGEEIPLSARIFAVVDVWDALTSDRPYRRSWSEDKVLSHINAGAGVHFDPEVVQTFVRMYPTLKAHNVKSSSIIDTPRIANGFQIRY